MVGGYEPGREDHEFDPRLGNLFLCISKVVNEKAAEKQPLVMIYTIQCNHSVWLGIEEHLPMLYYFINSEVKLHKCIANLTTSDIPVYMCVIFMLW